MSNGNSARMPRPRIRPKFTSANTAKASSIGVSSYNDEDNNPYFPSREYLCLVVQCNDGDWRYVRINSSDADVMNQPYLYDKADADKLMLFFKRAVVDQVIPWDDPVRVETLRIVSYRMEIEDVTGSLFYDEDDLVETMRMAALAKLSDDEAMMLGLGDQKAKQRLFENADYTPEDQALMKELERARIKLDSNRVIEKAFSF